LAAAIRQDGCSAWIGFPKPFLLTFDNNGGDQVETLVRNAICQYKTYVAEAEILKKCLEFSEEPETQAKLGTAEAKVTVVDAWMKILSADEKFVIQKHLIEQIEWARVAFEYQQRWQREFARTERSLQIYQADGLRKIAKFANKYREMTLRLFSDIPLECGATK